MREHCTEEELILYHYGEAAGGVAIGRHLEACEACRSMFDAVEGTLTMMSAYDAPDRGDQYGWEVWQRIRHQLPEPDTTSWIGNWFRRDRVAMAAVAAGLAAVAFVAGREWPRQPADGVPEVRAQVDTGRAARGATSDVRQAVLLAAVEDHLDRSARVLTDIMNGPSRGNISTEQAWAEDLLTTSRLYRQDAIAADESSVAGVLDELERSLLEIVHSPSHISQPMLETLRRRIDAASLVFKVRVTSDDLRQRGPSSTERNITYPSTRTAS